tara:strand:+ start:1218 stop:2564 length:1347 start_codon:yes stop_codon:yes gene_type:complete
LKLTSHEKTILDLISKHPDIVDSPSARKLIAKQYGFSEKTLRNRIGDLKKYGIIKNSDRSNPGGQNIYSEETNLIDITSLLWSMRKSIIKNQLIIILITILFVFIIPKTYTSSALLMPPTSETGGMSSIMGALSSLPFGGLMSQTNDESLSTIAILKSRTLSEKVIKKFNLIDFYGVKNLDKALMALSDNTNFEVEDEGTIRISVDVETEWLHLFESEETAKNQCTNMAIYFVEQLDLINKSLKTEEASFHREFIGERYRQNLVDLKKAEDDLKLFQEKHKMVALPEQTLAAIEAGAAIKAQMLSNEVKLGVMLGALNTNHPKIENIKKENSELNKKMNELEYGSNVIGYKKSNLFPVLADVPELGVELVRLKREVEIQNTLFVFLTQQYEEAKIKEAKDTPTVQILDYPQMPQLKSAPKRVLILIFCIIVTFLVNILFILYKSENRI